MSGESTRRETRLLVQQALGGDTSAFAALVEKYQGMVCGLALHATGRFAEAEDIAQETLVEAYRRLASLRNPGKFAAWLRGIAVNKIRTWLRKRKRLREQTVDFGSNPEAAGRSTEQADPGMGSLRESVLRAIEGLPEPQRQAITLYYMDGRSYGDIAEFLSVPASTVKARMQGGRRRLKQEMMSMVETVLDVEKPGRELAVRILRKAVAQAKRARKSRDYQSLLQSCDKALGALERLPSTPKRRRTRIQVLHWQGQSQERWLGSPAEAVTCYRAALEIAGEIGDADGQARAVKAILLTHGRAGEFDAMKSAAERGAAMAGSAGSEELLAFCTAARDLCDDPGRKQDRSAGGGFALSHVRVSRTRGKLLLGAPVRDLPGQKGNVALNLRCGTPARPTLFSFLFGPPQLLPADPKLGDRWRGRFENDFRKKPLPKCLFLGETTVEADDQAVAVPAGSFRNCLKTKTILRPTEAARRAYEQEAWVLRQLSGTRWMWFAPGVGLVRLVNINSHDQVTDIVLVDSRRAGRSADYLPLEAGNWWRYLWKENHYPVAVLTETHRVVEASGSGAVISCALHSHKADESESRQHAERTGRFLRRSADPHLAARALLDRAGGEPARLRRAAREFARAGETELHALALHRLAWKYEHARQPAKALRTWLKIPEILNSPEHARDKATASYDVAGGCFRLKDFASMYEVARDAEDILRRLGDRRGIADAAGLADLARWLSRRQEKRLGGYSHGWADVFSTPSLLEGGDRASGSCAPISRHREGCAPACLGIERLLLLPVRVGRTWTDSWNDGSARGTFSPVVSRRVEARNETLEVPAGRFDKCVRVRAEIRTAAGAGGAMPEPDWQGYNDGVRIDWYAPGVGLVKVEYRHANGKASRIELVDCSLKAAGGSYFPNRVGNRWQYEWRDGRGRLLFREFWRVGAKKGKATYLGFGAYEYK